MYLLPTQNSVVVESEINPLSVLGFVFHKSNTQ